jgi:hypothetical protein
MKYLFTVITVLLITTQIPAQNELRAGMGINFGSTPSLKDYINQLAGYNEMGSFSSAVIFSAEYDRSISNTYDLGLEVAYLLSSETFNISTGQYDFSYHIIMPSITSYYVIRGEGYNFKFGGGVGIRLVSADESFPSSPSAINFTSTGIGFILRVAGNTRLSDQFYVNISGNLRYDLNGDLNGWEENHSTYYNQVNLNTFSAGVSLGITYMF